MDLGDIFGALFQPTDAGRPAPSRFERWFNRIGLIGFVLICALVVLFYSGF